MACRTSFLSRQRDVIASFLFGAHAVYTDFLPVETFRYFTTYFTECVHLVILFYYGVYIDLCGLINYQLQCLHQARNTEVVGISWRDLTAIISVQGAGKKVRALTLVYPIMTVTHATLLLKNNVPSYLRLLIGLKRET